MKTKDKVKKSRSSADLHVSTLGKGENADLKVAATKVNERTENVYENKRQGQEVRNLPGVELRCRIVCVSACCRSRPNGAAHGSVLQKWTNEPRMSMKTKDKVKKSRSNADFQFRTPGKGGNFRAEGRRYKIERTNRECL